MRDDEQTQPEPLENYQDDFDTDENTVDRATHDETDDPTKMFGVPRDEYRSELDGLASDELATGDNDIRGSVENTDHPEDQESV